MNMSLPIRLLAPLTIGLANAASAAQGPETDKCNENQGLQAMAPDLAPIGGAVSGTPLDPGETWPTNGTDTSDSPELIGTLEFELTGKFKFMSAGGLVQGSYIERNYNGADNRCKQHLRFKVKQGCVVKVRFNKYAHPLDQPLVADYRKDWPGMVASATASRSPVKGLTIDFVMERPVCAGETSRWLLLNTSIQTLVPVKGVQFIAPTEEVSPLRPIHVPAR
jgi:hypothetical protein